MPNLCLLNLHWLNLHSINLGSINLHRICRQMVIPQLLFNLLFDGEEELNHDESQIVTDFQTEAQLVEKINEERQFRETAYAEELGEAVAQPRGEDIAKHVDGAVSSVLFRGPWNIKDAFTLALSFEPKVRFCIPFFEVVNLKSSEIFSHYMFLVRLVIKYNKKLKFSSFGCFSNSKLR